MNRLGTKILFAFFFIIVASIGTKTVSFPPTSITTTFKIVTLSDQSGQGPHSELEGRRFHLTITGHTFVQKNLIPSYLSVASVFYDLSVSLENFQIRKLSLLIKDYLSYIYPTHNFW